MNDVRVGLKPSLPLWLFMINAFMSRLHFVKCVTDAKWWANITSHQIQMLQLRKAFKWKLQSVSDQYRKENRGITCGICKCRPFHSQDSWSQYSRLCATNIKMKYEKLPYIIQKYSNPSNQGYNVTFHSSNNTVYETKESLVVASCSYKIMLCGLPFIIIKSLSLNITQYAWWKHFISGSTLQNPEISSLFIWPSFQVGKFTCNWILNCLIC